VLGKGSVFWFTARLGRGSSAVPAGQVAMAEDAESQLRRRYVGASVLLAEDNAVNREIAVALLQNVGLVVDAVADGRAAVESAQRGACDLILMDMQMPVMDGLEATRAIRALPGWTDRPILALTANNLEEDRRACEAAGMNDLISKPTNPRDFYATLLKWLAKARPR
jgi:CheY-like chemotaxis protein